jgi:hypothetical protein
VPDPKDAAVFADLLWQSRSLVTIKGGSKILVSIAPFNLVRVLVRRLAGAINGSASAINVQRRVGIRDEKPEELCNDRQ